MCSKETSCPPTAVSSTSTEGTDLKRSKVSKVIEDIKKALENNDQALAVSITKKYLEYANNIPLNIAVTGECGSGKSTFVNAFRGIDNKDKRAAPTGVVETTKKPEPYPHPIYPNVILWDLPGIGTTKVPADEYLKYVELKKFNFFIIVSAARFTENDAKLAQEIKKMVKKFYFVRSKIDDNLSATKKSQREYDEKKTLQEIRKSCSQGLEEQGVASPQVFLVSSFDLHLYDFPDLHETMERELPSHKRDVLTLTLPNISKIIINKKKEVFSSQIKWYAVLSALAGALPIPQLSFVVDLGILVSVLTSYLMGFGLDKKSLENLSSTTNKSLVDLREVMKSPCSGNEITTELVASMLHSLPVSELSTAANMIKWIPVLGMPAGAILSFTSIYKLLSSALDSLSVDAENVLMEALGIE